MTGINIILLVLLVCMLFSAKLYAQKQIAVDSFYKQSDKTKGSVIHVLDRKPKEGKASLDSIAKVMSWQFGKLTSIYKRNRNDSLQLNEDTINSKTGKTPFNNYRSKDTLYNPLDSFRRRIKNLPASLSNKFDSSGFETSLKQSIVGNFPNLRTLKADSMVGTLMPSVTLNKLLKTKPLVRVNGGWVSYNYNFRSNIDTPFIEKDIQQHNSYGYISLSVGGLPFNVNYLLRRSNSSFFRDINDVQIQFDAFQFRNSLLGSISSQLQHNIRVPDESLFQFNIKGYLDNFRNVNGWLNDPLTLQKLLECKELISVPELSHTPGLPDTVNVKRAAEAKATATLFINLYEKRMQEARFLKSTLDSLQKNYRILKDAVALQKKEIGNLATSTGNLAVGSERNDSLIPKKYRWLFNIRKFGIGRNQLNYSELTSKNMSLTGLNFEYNSWYYFAFAAGTVDYRFRDFAIANSRRIPQYMTMIRLGVGKLERSYIIASVYRGRKQLFATSGNNAGLMAIDVTGFSLEAKWKLNSNSYLLGEVAESLSPDFRRTPAVISKFNLTDKSNKALSLRYHLYVPRTFSKIEAQYKFTGANFQSFSSFQTNSEIVSWSVKADQYLLKRKLKIALAIKRNDFSNPYIRQAYTNNTIFKSIQLTFRSKNLPVVSAGYAPMSQVTSVDSQFIENMFYSLNGSLTHSYKIGIRRATTTIIYNRFYNNYQDTGFIYYQAANVFFTQSIAFGNYNMNVAVSHSSNPNFQLTVFDAGVQFNVKRNGTIGLGVKVNEFNGQKPKTGLYGNIQLNFKKLGVFSLQYNDGFIPGNKNQLVKNAIMNAGFTKRF